MQGNISSQNRAAKLNQMFQTWAVTREIVIHAYIQNKDTHTFSIM